LWYKSRTKNITGVLLRHNIFIAMMSPSLDATANNVSTPVRGADAAAALADADDDIEY